MLKFKGKCLFVDDTEIDLPVKDKDGNRTDQVKRHRLTKIQLLVTCPDKSMRAISINGFDLPATFQSPKPGEDWETPEIRTYNATNPAAITCGI